MTDISKSTLQKIKKEKIRPFGKKRFFLKKSFIWILFGLSICLGIIATSVAIFQLKHADWDLYHQSNYSLLKFLALAVPYFWVIFILVFMGIAFNYFRQTEKGYRYNSFLLIFISVVISLIGGLALNQTDFSERLEIVFHENIPIYRRINRGRHRMWMSPDQGFLAGKIDHIVSEKEIGLTDLHGNRWRVDVSETIWRGRLASEMGLEIKIIGMMIGEGQFMAKEIRPMQGRRLQGRGRQQGSGRRN